MTLDIHNDIYKKLDFFIVNNKIPNLIFHGSNGSGKRTIVHNFINNVYKSSLDCQVPIQSNLKISKPLII